MNTKLYSVFKALWAAEGLWICGASGLSPQQSLAQMELSPPDLCY